MNIMYGNFDELYVITLLKQRIKQTKTKRYIIEYSELMSESLNIFHAGRKKIAKKFSKKIPPGSDSAGMRFQIPNWFPLPCSVQFSTLLFIFCFLCGNKTKDLPALCKYICGRKSLYKIFISSCTF